MGDSKYSRDRKRIYQEAENRSKGWRKAALKHLNQEYGAKPIKRAGKVVGVRLDEDRGVICKKKAFKSYEAAGVALEQIERYRLGEVSSLAGYIAASTAANTTSHPCKTGALIKIDTYKSQG